MDNTVRPMPFWLRIVLFIGIWAVWGIAYFGAARLAVRPAEFFPWDPVWRLPYVPAFVIPYTSAYFMPLVLLAAPVDRGVFMRFTACYLIALVVSAAVFMLWPLVPPRVPLGDGMLDRLLALQYGIDVNGNCFPSLHVSLVFITALAVRRCWPVLAPLAFAWASVVAVSTAFVRQHYVIDIIAGIAVAFVAWRLMFPKAKK